jgi:hypothetical protein
MLKALLLTILLTVRSLFAQSNCNHPSNVVRVDDENKRIFAIGSGNQIATPTKARAFLKPLAKYVSKCQPSWVADWNVSIFTEPTLALYKTEIENRSLNDTQNWASSYIGEYNSRDQNLVLHPLSPKNKKWLHVAE